MSALVIISLAALARCECGLIQSVEDSSPDLRTIYHGQGATSYQNVNFENFASVPIPKDLQVDDGHEYLIKHDFSLFDNYVEGGNDEEGAIDSSEAAEESSDDIRRLRLIASENNSPPSHYENYEGELMHE